VLASGGSISINGSIASLPNLGASIVSGNVICFALDLTNSLVWIRLNAGNWNNTAGANPATRTGGLTVPFGPALAAYPAWYSQQSPHVVTANFGDSAFAQAVPSGFTSGFPTVAPVTAGPRQSLIM
jgi:hypothetical protein